MSFIIRWRYFPNCTKIPEHLQGVITVFENNENQITSDSHQHKSDGVLAILTKDFIQCGFLVEQSKAKDDLIRVPVLYGENGKESLSFEVDAYNADTKTVVEVEAGRGYTNYQFLKDFFECCMMQDVDYFCVAIRKDYRGHKDFDSVCNFFTAMYASQGMILPLKGILVIGY